MTFTSGLTDLQKAMSSPLLSPVGAPYDTLEEVIGIRPSKCSLREYGVTYRQADLLPGGGFDYEAIRSRINERTKPAEGWRTGPRRGRGCRR